MDIKQIQRLKNSINAFEDSEFISIVDDNTAIVMNTNNSSLWKIGFSENKDGVLVFNTEQAECIQEAEEEISEGDQNVDNFRSALHAVFSEDKDEAIEQLGELVTTLPFKEKEDETLTVETDEKDIIYTSGIIDEVANIYEAFKDQLSAVGEIQADFATLGFLFGEEDIKRGNITDPFYIVEAYRQKALQRELVFQGVDKAFAYKEQLDSHFGNEVAETIFEHINISTKKDFDVSSAKALMYAKREHGTSINTLTDIKLLNSIYEELMTIDEKTDNPTPLPFTFNQTSGQAPHRFTKFNLGVFTREDLETLERQLRNAMTHKDLPGGGDDLRFINELMMRIHYMSRTNQIDDEAVADVIQKFNGRYSKDNSATYRDPRSALGWKSQGQQSLRSAHGQAVQLGQDS